ncbi:hypothetical protein P22_2693 [Propionispora sp. 2/2-37]|uniref:DUF6883 domain-containing protein n=1 Tax=Propionispora sp. 2/2-37 TaxID=1677858 RepID=UPI0006C3AA81|nr:DUF6883 domain-containing protein [Propionispora sp. 2/2-37]CUH96603.1 hypothetical protein P22_2693 [Propionispora sp. 2/2-37]
MADLSGADALSGAVAAGINEAVQKHLTEMFKGNPAMHQWASALIGATVAEFIGGDVQTGGSVAVSGTKNNLLAYFLTNTQDALKDALRAKNGEEPTDQQLAELNAQISAALTAVFPDGKPTVEGEASVIRSVLQQNGIPLASIEDFITVYTSQASGAVEQYNLAQLKQGTIRTTALIDTISDNIKGTIDLIYLMTPVGQKELVQALLQDPTLPATIGQAAYNSLKNWAVSIQGNNGDEAQAKAQGQLLGQVLTAYATAKGTSAFQKLGVGAKEPQLPEVVVTGERIPSGSAIAEGSGNAVSNVSSDIRKFTEYIFKDGAAPGKDVVFKNLGYGVKDSESLIKIYNEQAAAKFAKGEYTLGKADSFGQRINIEIELPGIGDAAGKTSYLKSGWMIKPDGSLTLNTPFAGFTK